MTEEITPEIREYRLANKLCTGCGSARDGKRALCTSCRNRLERERQQTKRAERQAAQRCGECGGPRDDEHRACSGCRLRIAAQRRLSYRRNRPARRLKERLKAAKKRERRKLNPPAPAPELTPREKGRVKAARIQEILYRLKMQS